jgi:hypothetical protein
MIGGLVKAFSTVLESNKIKNNLYIPELKKRNFFSIIEKLFLAFLAECGFPYSSIIQVPYLKLKNKKCFNIFDFHF